MNEAETRAELIDPKFRACGWGVIEDSKILRERDVCKITDGRIQVGGGRTKPLIADYILVYKGVKLAVVEAKSNELGVGEGVAQAKLYAQKLALQTTYSTNGEEIYSICMQTGVEGLVSDFLSPDALWEKTYSDQNEWREKFASIPFEDKSGTWQPRYYQELAVKNTLEAIAQNKERILLTLATGTGKTAIAFQIAWKLFHTRWNLKRDGKRRPRILFLADRNILADQAFNSFSAFPEDAMVRIKPKEIKKSKKVPTNGSIFFTIFQSFMSGTAEDGESEPYFGEYPQDYFDFIIIDECHRGGANDEGKLYKEEDFNKIIEIKAREEKRVQIFMNEENENDKTIIFCATQEHASAVRELVNQNKKQSENPNYCVRVTANDGEIGEQFLREFQDNEKLIPTVLTTSQKLSTGVDARNIRNIVLMRPVNQIIEFKQIVGRGTRLYDGKEFFSIYDFVDAYQRFSDPEWDGEPLEPEPIEESKEPATPKKQSDLFDVLEYVLAQYIETGFEELAKEKLPVLLTNKYQSLEDAKKVLGEVKDISSLFIEFQKHLYMQEVA